MKSITFGKRLTEVRKNKKMSQDEVGKLVGVHGAVIGRYEREEVKPSIEMATQLAEVLEVSLGLSRRFYRYSFGKKYCL